MAHITEVSIREIGETGRDWEMVEASVAVRCEPEDVGRTFILNVYLYEKEGKLDGYYVAENGEIQQIKNGLSDDFVGLIGRRELNFEEEGRHPVLIERAWDFNVDRGKKKYYAVATLVPVGLIYDVRVSQIFESRVG